MRGSHGIGMQQKSVMDKKFSGLLLVQFQKKSLLCSAFRVIAGRMQSSLLCCAELTK